MRGPRRSSMADSTRPKWSSGRSNNPSHQRRERFPPRSLGRTEREIEEMYTVEFVQFPDEIPQSWQQMGKYRTAAKAMREIADHKRTPGGYNKPHRVIKNNIDVTEEVYA